MNQEILTQLLLNYWPQLITGLLIPLLVGLVTRLDAHPFLKAFINFVISTLVGVIEAFNANGHVWNTEQVVSYILAIWGVSHLSYKMVWKPMGGGGADPVRAATPDIGVG